MTSLFGLIALILSYVTAPVGTADTVPDQQQLQRCSATVDTSTGGTTVGQAPPTKHISNGF